jgi:3-phenylpropionate/cinnamic acid dioxygenase small subunit
MKIATALPSEADLINFPYYEARLIDEKRFDEWYDLFTATAFYWMPLTRGQPDALNHTSLFYEDKLLLKIRIERLRNPRSFSQSQPSYSQHVLQRPGIEQFDPSANVFVTRTPFIYVEAQRDQQLMLTGVVYHHLCAAAGQLCIQLKKIELLNCDAALPSIQLFP